MSTVRDLSGRTAGRRRFRRQGSEEREREADAVSVASDLSDVDLSGIAEGAVLYYDGSNVVDLGIGTADQVLRVNSGATAPEWGSGASLGFRATRATNQTLSAATVTKIVYDNELYDDEGAYDPSTGEYTVQESSEHIIAAGAVYTSLSDGDRVVIYVYVNGTKVTELSDFRAGAAGVLLAAGAAVLDLTAGDTVAIHGFRTSAGDISSTSGNGTSFSVVRL